MQTKEERLKRAFNYLKLEGFITTRKDIAEKLKYNEATVSMAFKGSKKHLTNSFISNFCKIFNQIEEEWLKTGIGEMLKITNDKGFKKEVPFWNLQVSAGRSILEIIGSLKPDGYISGLPGADLAENILPVIGTSMEPEISSGAIIGVRKMDNWETLNTERIYLIITKDDRMIKRIEHDSVDENILWCISPNYPKFKIFKSDIIEIQRVCFVYNAK